MREIKYGQMSCFIEPIICANSSYLYWSKRDTALALNPIQQPLLIIFSARGNLESNIKKNKRNNWHIGIYLFHAQKIIAQYTL